MWYKTDCVKSTRGYPVHLNAGESLVRLKTFWVVDTHLLPQLKCTKKAIWFGGIPMALC